MRRRPIALLAVFSTCAAAAWGGAAAQPAQPAPQESQPAGAQPQPAPQEAQPAAGQPQPAPQAAPSSNQLAAQPSAENLERLRSTILSLIRALVDQKILAPEKAADLLKQAGIEPAALNQEAQAPATPAAPGAPPTPAPPVVRVPYVPEVVKREMREELKQEIVAQARAERWGEPGTLPEWLSRISLYGDTRIRFASDRLDSGNEPLVEKIDTAYQFQPPNSVKNDVEARDRFKIRARIGLDAKLSDDLRTDIRIATSNGGDGNNAFTEDVVLGQYNRRLGIALDLAYVQWDPIRSLSIRGGRIANPYYSTDLIWANDLTFDGAAITYKPRLTESWSAFTTIGAHPILAATGSPASDAWNEWLYAGQVGLEAAWLDRSSFHFGAAYYDFSNIEGKVNPVNTTLYNNSIPLFRQGGNTMFDINILNDVGGTPSFALASKFRVFDALARYEWGRFDPIRIGLTGEYVRNFGFDAKEISQRIGLNALCISGALCVLPQDRTGATGLQRPRTVGYLGLLQIGASTVAERGQWQAFFGYRYLERDAVVDSFTSSDYRFGGTDQRAPFAGFSYGLARGTATTLRYISARSLDLAPLYNDDTWLLDVVSRF